MEKTVKILPPETLMEPLLELLKEADQVPLVISGNSMSPFLVHGRDIVFLSRVAQPLKRGDMILYRRDNGAYILHRICAVEGDRFCLVGDAQQIIERGVRSDQVLAVVTAVRRKGKLLKKGSFWWEFFARVWLRLIPFRQKIRSLYGHLFGKK